MPTENQKAAVKETLENLRQGKKVALGKILRKHGYSENVSKQPSIVTESKGWQQLLEEALPDELLNKVHKQFLKKKEKIVVGVGKGFTQIEDTGQPHTDALKAIEMARKLKGHFIDRTDLTSGGKPIVLIDQATATKYAIAPSPTPDSE